MQRPCLADLGDQVECGSVPLEHAISDEYDSVTRLEHQVAGGVLLVRKQSQWHAGRQLNRRDLTAAGEVGRVVPSVDEGERTAAQLNRPRRPVAYASSATPGAYSDRAALAAAACSSSDAPWRRVLRRLPTHKVAIRR